MCVCVWVLERLCVECENYVNFFLLSFIYVQLRVCCYWNVYYILGSVVTLCLPHTLSILLLSKLCINIRWRRKKLSIPITYSKLIMCWMKNFSLLVTNTIIMIIINSIIIFHLLIAIMLLVKKERVFNFNFQH